MAKIRIVCVSDTHGKHDGLNVPDGDILIRRYWNMIPASTNVIITHGPPKCILDQINPSREHLGCVNLAKTAERITPLLHVFGHIHGGHGNCLANGTHYVNAAILNERYCLVHAAQVVDLEPTGIESYFV